ncbi:hypothetical protein SSX86_025845 [Deinandra increscens subsp. villosa]|uniref:beta-ketoacyl-[acyl-carrier-protein] synthase I n=1 Tax=Deinandra increscens subsp. villosa TaxID=3103831 RepID=A0AAP0GMJ0_9ASTR
MVLPSPLGKWLVAAACMSDLHRFRPSALRSSSKRSIPRKLQVTKTMAIAVQPAKTNKKTVTSKKQRRVVVTGLGVVSPVGDVVDVFYQNLLEGVSGISEIQSFDCQHFPTAREVKSFSPDGWIAPKFAKRVDKYMLYLLTAGKKALGDGGVTKDVMKELDITKCGVIIGSALGGMKDMMLSGGSDSVIIPIGLGGFVACNSLSQRNGDPTKASRPWDVSRDGFVMGEGAGVLLLEELEHAKARDAKIYAEFMGGSSTLDAYYMTEPHPDGTGIALCIEKALAQSGVAREDVNYINAHATSAQFGDLSEYEAIIRCFGDNSELKINSTKSMIGHLLGAAGAVEAVATVKKIAGEVKSFSPDGWIAPKFAKRVDKYMLYLLTAGKKALGDGGVTKDVMKELDITKCGVIIGSALGGMKVFQDGIEALRVSYRKMNPRCIPFTSTNTGSAMLAMDLGWMGPAYSISAACATSNICILNAANSIIRGETDMMLSGGSDSVIIPIGLGGFVACNSLSQRNGDPTKASRPWDVSRDGFVMGEGAGVLLLEELEHAKARDAKIYAEFMGGSSTLDAYYMTEPHPDGTGIALCIEKALAQSGVAREDVNYINAHATSAQFGDLSEYEAIIRCFGDNSELKINSTKSMIGHLLGAAGAVEAVATVKAIQTGWLHPNINLENPDAGVDKNVLVGAKKEEFNIKVALSNSFGFGGQNSSILFAPYKDQ